MNASRQLAAILFTDIVGYTALMGEDEAQAFQLLKANRQLQKPLIEHFNGRWVKEIGDGILAIFTSATDAVACACTILNDCYKIPGLQLRIGIHLGDIVIENGDAFGDSVNIAARLQALAPINGIWLSEAVFKNVLNKKGIEASFVKEETLKNVREPVRIYEVNFKTFSPQQFMSTTASDSRVEFLGEKGQKKELKREEENKFCLTSKDRPSFTIKSNGKRTIIGACILLLLAWPAYKFYGHWKRVERAKKELLPEIQKLTSTDYFFNSPKAYELAKEAELIIPNDSALLLAWPKFSSKISIYTTPSDANVYWKDYGSSDDQWVLLGKTPLEKIWIPNRFPEIKLQKKGFATVLNPPIFRTAKLHKSDCRPSLNLRPKWRKKENCWRLGAEVFPLKLARQPDCQFIVANAATASEAPG